MIKNYLVKGLHRIGSTKWWPGRDRADEGDLYHYYQKMSRLSEASFFTNLQGNWELIRLESHAQDVNHAFRQQFRAIWNIWSSEPCNIFYCGSDVQVLHAVEVFGRYQHFLLFNYTDPKSLEGFPHFLNADIRYYPAEMDRIQFEQALRDITSCTQWNDDQKLYNRMVWEQGLEPEQVIDPRMAYQGPWLEDTSRSNRRAYVDRWNGCRLEEAWIAHWHGSRNAKIKLDLMQSINDQLGITPQSVDGSKIRTIDVTNLS